MTAQQVRRWVERLVDRFFPPPSGGACATPN